ncbi:hypothetical protein H8L32_00340 [Undibacterium sp. CY18W]|uniref:Uncharacterized protein n=1 Tax=Undibacterium hunanense TaxID=2762292 RepID=A0ABR6ZJ36_9BURK|nr:hypothetical protein [Undibacterium hunanense]MBC3915918.1 hypothetical protein [Undibacterium hunanense]
MSHLELIIPFGIPPAGLAKDLLKEMHTPALAALIASGGRPQTQTIDAFSHALAHEYWLADQFPPENNANSPAISWDTMQACGLTVDAGYWFTLQPVHIHIARDHLVLTDQRRLELPDDQARILFDIARSSCEEVGLTLLYGDAKTWFLRADDWSALRTATMDAACGHNIDIWMPKGEHERAWRKLQNEIQMLWFGHAINEAREMQGEKVINSVWISCGADHIHPTAKQVMTASNFTNWQETHSGAEAKHTLLLPDLAEAAINNDWGLWLEKIDAMEKNWFSPVMSALKTRKITRLDLMFTDARSVANFSLTPWSLRKFWVKPSLHHLFSIAKP